MCRRSQWRRNIITWTHDNWHELANWRLHLGHSVKLSPKNFTMEVSHTFQMSNKFKTSGNEESTEDDVSPVRSGCNENRFDGIIVPTSFNFGCKWFSLRSFHIAVHRLCGGVQMERHTHVSCSNCSICTSPHNLCTLFICQSQNVKVISFVKTFHSSNVL